LEKASVSDSDLESEQQDKKFHYGAAKWAKYKKKEKDAGKVVPSGLTSSSEKPSTPAVTSASVSGSTTCLKATK